MTPEAVRKQQQRQRDRDAGLIEVTVKIPASRKRELLEYIATLQQHNDSA